MAPISPIAIASVPILWSAAKAAVDTFVELHGQEANFATWYKKYLTTIRMSPKMRTKLSGLANLVRAGKQISSLVLPSISDSYNELEALPGVVVAKHMNKTIPDLMDTKFNTQDVQRADTEIVNPDMVFMDPHSLRLAYSM